MIGVACRPATLAAIGVLGVPGVAVAGSPAPPPDARPTPRAAVRPRPAAPTPSAPVVRAPVRASPSTTRGASPAGTVAPRRVVPRAPRASAPRADILAATGALVAAPKPSLPGASPVSQPVAERAVVALPAIRAENGIVEVRGVEPAGGFGGVSSQGIAFGAVLLATFLIVLTAIRRIADPEPDDGEHVAEPARLFDMATLPEFEGPIALPERRVVPRRARDVAR